MNKVDPKEIQEIFDENSKQQDLNPYTKWCQKTIEMNKILANNPEKMEKMLERTSMAKYRKK